MTTGPPDSRRTPVGGRAVAIDAAGAFTAPAAVGERLVVTTEAGDATAVVVTEPPLG